MIVLSRADVESERERERLVCVEKALDVWPHLGHLSDPRPAPAVNPIPRASLGKPSNPAELPSAFARATSSPARSRS